MPSSASPRDIDSSLYIAPHPFPLGLQFLCQNSKPPRTKETPTELAPGDAEGGPGTGRKSKTAECWKLIHNL